MPLADQIAELAALEDGWLDGDGTAYEQAFLQLVAGHLRYMMEALELPTPYLYPTGDGDIRAEWPSEVWEVVLRFDAGGESAHMVACRVGSTDFQETEVSLRGIEYQAVDDVGNAIFRLLHEESAP